MSNSCWIVELGQVPRHVNLRSRQELSNAHLVAKFGANTAENEILKVCEELGQTYVSCMRVVRRILSRKSTTVVSRWLAWWASWARAQFPARCLPWKDSSRRRARLTWWLRLTSPSRCSATSLLLQFKAAMLLHPAPAQSRSMLFWHQVNTLLLVVFGKVLLKWNACMGSYLFGAVQIHDMLFCASIARPCFREKLRNKRKKRHVEAFVNILKHTISSDDWGRRVRPRFGITCILVVLNTRRWIEVYKSCDVRSLLWTSRTLKHDRFWAIHDSIWSDSTKTDMFKH